VVQVSGVRRNVSGCRFNRQRHVLFRFRNQLNNSGVITDMRKEVFKTGYPSSAFMEARKLKTPGALLEIQAIAVLKEQRGIGISE
jgi:hypothetical protein